MSRLTDVLPRRQNKNGLARVSIESSVGRYATPPTCSSGLALLRIGEVAEFAVSRPGCAVTVRAAMAEREPWVGKTVCPHAARWLFGDADVVRFRASWLFNNLFHSLLSG